MEYDAIVVGYGQGAASIVVPLIKEGWKVALIEKDPLSYGGSCINFGCIPTKLLDHDARNGVPYADAVARRNRDIEEKRDGQKQAMEDNEHVDLYTGKASFKDNYTIEVALEDDPLTLTSKHIFIGTGSSANIPDIEGIDDTENIYTSRSLQTKKNLPKRLGILGSGNIGLEYASIYASFGSQVEVFDRSETFLEDEEPEIAEAMKEALTEKGVIIQQGSSVEKVKNDGDQVVATTDNGEDFTFDAFLVATGRAPNVEDLNLENTDITLTDKKGIEVDDHLQTAVKGVYAIGDVRGEDMFTYVTLKDAAIVVSDVLSDGDNVLSKRKEVPYTIFVDPPLSRVGYTEAQAREAGIDVYTNTIELADTPRATVINDRRGVFKAVVDKHTNLILGASLLGPQAHELINQVKMAMDNNIPASYLKDQMMTHPTSAEQLNTLFNLD